MTAVRLFRGIYQSVTDPDDKGLRQANLLVRGAGKLALSFGISPLVVGLTIVAFGTSAPEVGVSVSAVLAGNADMAVGNVVGSNIFNVLFILGISALIVPLVVNRQLICQEVPIMIGWRSKSGGTHMLLRFEKTTFTEAEAVAMGSQSVRNIERRIKAWAGQPMRTLRRLQRAEQAFFATRADQEGGQLSLS